MAPNSSLLLRGTNLLEDFSGGGGKNPLSDVKAVAGLFNQLCAGTHTEDLCNERTCAEEKDQILVDFWALLLL